MMDIQVDTRPLIRKLRMLEDRISPFMEQATKECLEHIHMKAMENLDSNLIWGHGVQYGAEEESIRNSVIIDHIAGTLTYTSPHARLIEYGGTYVYNRPKELGPMPIGQHEGHTEGFGYNIVGIFPGKYFLTRAFMSERDVVYSIYERYRDNLIKSLG